MPPHTSSHAEPEPVKPSEEANVICTTENIASRATFDCDCHCTKPHQHPSVHGCTLKDTHFGVIDRRYRLCLGIRAGIHQDSTLLFVPTELHPPRWFQPRSIGIMGPSPIQKQKHDYQVA